MEITDRSVFVHRSRHPHDGSVVFGRTGASLSAFAPGVNKAGVAIDVGDGESFKGRSDSVDIDTVVDPFNLESTDGVLHIKSIHDDSDTADGVTFDIAISFIEVSDRGFTISNIADYDGDDAGLVYDWGVTIEDAVGVDTDYEGVGAPDDVWFFIEENPQSAGNNRSRPFFIGTKPIFRRCTPIGTKKPVGSLQAGSTMNGVLAL